MELALSELTVSAPADFHTTGASDSSDAESEFTTQLVGLIPQLRLWAKRLYRDEEAAADLAQETLTKAWQSQHRFARGTNLRGWLLTIMNNQFRSELRRNWRRAPWDQEAAEQLPGAKDEQVWTAELSDAARALDSLSKRQREAFILIDVGGYSSEEAAAISHCGSAAIKSRASRARQSVLAMLNGEEQIKFRKRPAPGSAADKITSELDRLKAGAVAASARTSKARPHATV
ncbi:MAG TPA: sigma-70 family RNA polymerase sigma factor [Rhizomicrobium sp.]|jgi:RNA polymerase sigma-70 factor (ECF subfamily)